MATVNGDFVHSPDAFGGLGKRKRETSQDLEESEKNLARLHSEKAQESVEGVLKLLRNYDPSPSLLKYPLPVTPSDEPDSKRPRLVKSLSGIETIESRVSAGHYISLEEMVEDVKRAASAILDTNQALSEQVNGESKSYTVIDSRTRQQITSIRDIVAKQLEKQKRQSMAEKADTKDRTNFALPKAEERIDSDPQVLTLRASTEKGPRQVYSGLQQPVGSIQSLSEDHSPHQFDAIDGKTLPNGFDLAEAAFLDAQTKPKSPHATRTFGDVFRPHSKLKPLELPRTFKPTSGNVPLEFAGAASSALERALPAHKADYKFEKLPTSEWVQYTEIQNGQKRRQSDSSKAPKDMVTKPRDLFYSSYSSFAPSQDSSAAVVSERDRTRLWWNRSGETKFRRMFSLEDPDEKATIANTSDLNIDEDFSTLLADYIEEPIPNHLEQENENELMDVDSLLGEVSDLLETLSSYQRIRNSEARKTPTQTADPSVVEFDTHEMLKSQLALIISSLPPFAVAKLNGDQLQDLNISTTFVAERLDCPGSGEVDDYTMQRRKAAAAAVSAAARTGSVSATPATARPSVYQSPSTATYNPRAIPFSAPVPAANMAAYKAMQSRTPVPTPRPSYPQQAYQQAATPSYQQPSVQQFQRPVQNGYSNYAANTPSHVPYTQRPTQPGYQQRAQDNAGNYGMRSASPQKPLPNGQQYQPQPVQTPYAQPPRPIGAVANAMQNVGADQRARIEQARSQQQVVGQVQSPYPQAQIQRQNLAGMPLLPQGGGYGGGSINGQYEGADEERATPGTSVGEGGRDRSASAAVSVGVQ